MSKQSYREQKRVAPLGIAGIEAIRAILTGHQASKVNEVLVDAFSASAIIQVYDAINDANKAKLIALPVARVADIAFKLANKS